MEISMHFHTDTVKIRNGRSSPIHIPISPLLSRINKPQNAVGNFVYCIMKYTLPKRVLSHEYTVRCNMNGKIYPVRRKQCPNATAATARPPVLLYTYTTVRTKWLLTELINTETMLVVAPYRSSLHCQHFAPTNRMS